MFVGASLDLPAVHPARLTQTLISLHNKRRGRTQNGELTHSGARLVRNTGHENIHRLEHNTSQQTQNIGFPRDFQGLLKTSRGFEGAFSDFWGPPGTSRTSRYIRPPSFS